MINRVNSWIFANTPNILFRDFLENGLSDKFSQNESFEISRN